MSFRFLWFTQLSLEIAAWEKGQFLGIFERNSAFPSLKINRQVQELEFLANVVK